MKYLVAIHCFCMPRVSENALDKFTIPKSDIAYKVQLTEDSYSICLVNLVQKKMQNPDVQFSVRIM